MAPAGGGPGPLPTTLPAAVLPQDSSLFDGPWPALASSRGPVPSGPGAPISVHPEPTGDGDATCTGAAPAGEAIRPAPSPGPSALTPLPAQQRTAAPPSFAQALLRSSSPPTLPLVTHGPAVTDLGEPAAFFTLEEIKISCSPLDFSVIARTPQGRPPFPEIRAHLVQRFMFSQDFFISALDSRHLLIRFQNKADFLLVLLKNAMYVLGKPFFFFKWTMDFTPDKDCPVVPVWIELPGLPANFYNVAMINSLAGSIGPVLQVDKSTVHLMRTHAARANVQMDVSKQMPDRIWVGIGGGGYWQPIMYPDLPKFCKGCHRLGHIVATCKKTMSRPTQGTDSADPAQSASKAPRAMVTGMRPIEKGEWRPKLFKDVTSAPPGNQQRPMAVDSATPGTAHHLFDEMPTQQPTTQMAMGSVSGVKEGGPHLPSAACLTFDGSNMPLCIAHGPAQVSKAQQPPSVLAPMAAAPSTPADQAFQASAITSLHDSGYGTPLQLGIHHSASLSDIAAPIKPKQPAAAVGISARQMLDESPQPGQHGAQATTAAEGSSAMQTACQMFDEMPQPGQQSQAAAGDSSPDSGYGTPQPLGTQGNAPPSIMAAPRKLKQPIINTGTRAHQVFAELPQPGQHSKTEGITALGAEMSSQQQGQAMEAIVPPSDSHSSSPPGESLVGSLGSAGFSSTRVFDEMPLKPHSASLEAHCPQGEDSTSTFTGDNLATVKTPTESLPIKAQSEVTQEPAQQILAPAISAAMVTSLPPDSSAKPDGEYGTPIQIDTHSNPKADQLLDDPNQFARFLQESPCPESSPTSARLSFAEALRKKTKKSGPWPPPPVPPPLMATRAAPPQPVSSKPRQQGGYINLPVLYNIRSAPGLEPPGELTSQQLNTLHVNFAGRPRTRSTTICAPDSDEDYEDRSD